MIENYLKEIIDKKIDERIKDLIYELSLAKPPEKEFYNIEEVVKEKKIIDSVFFFPSFNINLVSIVSY